MSGDIRIRETIQLGEQVLVGGYLGARFTEPLRADSLASQVAPQGFESLSTKGRFTSIAMRMEDGDICMLICVNPDEQDPGSRVYNLTSVAMNRGVPQGGELKALAISPDEIAGLVITPHQPLEINTATKGRIQSNSPIAELVGYDKRDPVARAADGTPITNVTATSSIKDDFFRGIGWAVPA